MGKLLEQKKKEFGSAREKQERAVDNSKDPLQPFRDAKEKDVSMELEFDLNTSEGTLIAKRGGVTIILEADVLEKDLPYYKDSNKAKFVSRPFVVRITDIDEETCTVYTRSAWNNSHSTRSRLIGEIMADLDNGKEVVLPGRVLEVNDKRALVDLLGAEILGICTVSEWQNGYVRHLNAMAKKNTIYDFVVTKPMQQKKGRTQAFNLSRVSITPDPWVKLEEDGNVGVDSIIAVTCVDKPVGKSYWWGVSPLVEGIEIMCDYSTSIKRPMKSVTYRCKVIKCDPKAHKLQAVPFDIVDNGNGNKEAIEFLYGKRTKAAKK